MWLVLSLVVALSTTARNIIQKRLLHEAVNPFVLGGVQFTLSGFLLIIFLAVVGTPPVGGAVYSAVFVSLVLNILATIFLYRSLKLGDLSLVTPIGTFLPVFLLITSYLILGEIPTRLAVFGILMVVVGSYVLHWDRALESPWAIVTRILRHRASLYMLAVAFLWSISANFDKIGSRDSSPIFYSAALDILLGLSLLLILVFTRSGDAMRLPKRAWPWLVLLGCIFAVSTAANFTAFTLTNISYVSAVHYLNAVLTVLYGIFFLKEKSGLWRFIGAAFMVSGVVFIAL